VRCFLTGASGLLGTRLQERLLEGGHELVALSRRVRRDDRAGVRWVEGDATTTGPWMRELDGCDAVVHLAGESVAEGRWTAARKRALVDSRVESARRLGEAIRAAEAPPAVLVSASAVGYYGPRGEEELAEDAPPGEDFLARLCVDWEAAAHAAGSGATRVACLRIGVVLAPEGGALAKMVPPFKLGLGGPLGPARNWFPWIHEDDVVGLLVFLLEQPVEGAVNGVASGAVRMGEFARELGRALHRPALLPTPIAPLKLVLGEFAGHLNPGQHVVPRRALEAGYRFAFPELGPALRDCVERR